MGVTTTGDTLKNYIAGEWVESSTERFDEIPNPATGEIMSRVPLSTRSTSRKRAFCVSSCAARCSAPAFRLRGPSSTA